MQPPLGSAARCLVFLLILAAAWWPPPAAARERTPKERLAARYGGHQRAEGRTIMYIAHSRGNIQLAVANNGTFGTLGTTIADPITGEAIQACVYPKNTDLVYLWVAAVWIGAVVGRDTLVSVGNEDFYVTEEFSPVDYDWEDLQPPLGFKYRSIDINSSWYHPEALSEEDIICTYADTLDDPAIVESDNTDNRPHKPLGVKITQRSMAWSYAYADDFILFDYQVENIGQKLIRDIYIGIYVDGDVWHVTRNGPDGWNDDVVGFYRTHPAEGRCGFIDTINVAWHADNDGDPDETSGEWDYRSPRSAVGVRVVRTPAAELAYSYNWWIINYSDPSRDFGPRTRPTDSDPFRNFGRRIGSPEGDRNKYYMLRHEEFDYDLYYTATIGPSNAVWMPPPADQAAEIARGYDSRYLLSFGPFDINPGQKLPVSFAWLGGEDFHTQADAFETLFDPYNPTPFYNYLGFDKLAGNAKWASWVYDNPGVDTDSDGYAGRAHCQASLADGTPVCLYNCDDTVGAVSSGAGWDVQWYVGDEVPDFRGAGPPVAPRIRVIPSDGRLIVRWNGYYSETTEDFFLNAVDFEGYRVYLARDNRPGSFSVLSSYDHENYNRYVFDATRSDWVLQGTPLTLDELRVEYGDSLFDPLRYTPSSSFAWEGSHYYFTRQDNNRSDLTSSRGIHKVYPDSPRPPADRAEWRPDDLTFEHGEGLPKYYEYEYVIDDLLLTVPYYAAVTAFDFGSPVVGLPPLETSPLINAVLEYPQTAAAAVAEDRLDVYVYPNPYRLDGDYRGLGFEGRQDSDRPDERVRKLHFANLPLRCTISIFSLDGDLIKRIEHDRSPGDASSAHEEWNLITRNTQILTTGLYYWVVESEGRTQIGKFAVIR
ncbi:MAG TPA: hypothetical protein PK186_00405 [candidate division Zixibacteria bacterium]|nr:hypothetical protein [candidate division Zixibacteria bacterium]MDD4918875.1 hypothetical protein [candidate division Zixibacteria bacterium]MDM7973881.1 hypothetical protein [candidate division Zixibacteria bacterium]HOD66655.1 hypothetical protein [candidate division Zixibacteria bacterium]HPM35999.1 hypothetical protein [candidate division Zixibacteria bacterium]